MGASNQLPPKTAPKPPMIAWLAQNANANPHAAEEVEKWADVGDHPSASRVVGQPTTTWR